MAARARLPQTPPPPPSSGQTLEKLPPLDSSDPKVKRPVAASFTALEMVKEHPVEKLVTSYSSWPRLLRMLACFTLASDVCRKKILRPRSFRPSMFRRQRRGLWLVSRLSTTEKSLPKGASLHCPVR